MNHIILKAQLEARVKPDAVVGFIAWCPALDITSQGKTIRASLKALTEAVQLFLEFCFEHGTLDEALHELGFSKARVPEKNTFSHSEHTIEVPMELVANVKNSARLLENPR